MWKESKDLQKSLLLPVMARLVTLVKSGATIDQIRKLLQQEPSLDVNQGDQNATALTGAIELARMDIMQELLSHSVCSFLFPFCRTPPFTCGHVVATLFFFLMTAISIITMIIIF